METFVSNRETLDMAVLFIWLVIIAIGGVYAQWVKVN